VRGIPQVIEKALVTLSLRNFLRFPLLQTTQDRRLIPRDGVAAPLPGALPEGSYAGLAFIWVSPFADGAVFVLVGWLLPALTMPLLTAR
tara:strand:+ start:586 stop:852 length:267 start_codon:yes stop_codon:yes gene_type:complete